MGFLQQFHLVIRYNKGIYNNFVDMLSRPFFSAATLLKHNYVLHELYVLVKSMKKWKHYLIVKETIIHTDHQPLQYLQSQTKLQKPRHFRWMGFLQQFHLVIGYKKGIYNKVVDMLSRPIISATTLLKHNYVFHESYV